MSRTLSPAAALALLLPLGSDAAPPGIAIPLDSEDRSEIERSLGPGVLGEALPAPAIGDPKGYLATAPRSGRYRVHDESGAESEQSFEWTPIGQERPATSWHYRAGGTDNGFLALEPDGSFVLTGVEDTETGAVTRYEPAEPFLLKGMQPGEERRLRMAVKVYELARPSEITHEGALEVGYRYLGAYRLTVPAGTFDAVVMKSHFVGRVGPARLEDTQYRFFAPGAGLVASIERRDVSAFLLYRAHLKEAKLLAGD